MRTLVDALAAIVVAVGGAWCAVPAGTCGPSVTEIDRNFVAELRRVTQFAIDADGMLNALDGAGTVVFRFRRASGAYDD